MTDRHESSDGCVAIVGMAGRFPGAADVRALWSNLAGGVESIRRLSEHELARAGVPDALRRDPAFVPVAADLAGIELFDDAFFGIPAREASVTDPQQRLLLELAWEAFEDACHPPESLGGAVGVWVGASDSDWRQRVEADPRHLRELGAFALSIATGRDFLASRLSWAFDLTGPSATVQTACSTSLVAVHVACQALLAGECDAALAGGVSVRLPQGTGYLHVDGGVASRDGHCRPFDADASGTVPGNGGGLVLLRRLADAEADGDRVVAVIRGSAVGNDGRQKLGFTAPGVDGQAAVIEEALAVAGVEPRTVGYVEAHGTGTPLGDPIELAALRRAFARARRAAERAPRSGACLLGSVKSNLGHLDAAAGIAGLIKAALVVEHGLVPPSLHFRRANPELGLDASGFRVAAEGCAFPSGDGPRRAGVSSFGIGGTNAHVVLEQAPQAPVRPPAGGPHELLVSARTPAALAASAERLARCLEEETALDLADVAWSLRVGRRTFGQRLRVVARGAREAAAALRAAARGEGGRAQGAAAAAPDGAGRRRVPLPTYPWERRRLWIAPEAAARDDEVVVPAPAPERRDAAAADGDVATVLARIWCDLLGLVEVGAGDDFFELGGDSLLALQVCDQVEARLGVHLPAADPSEATVLAELAARIEERRAAGEEGPLVRLAGRASADDAPAFVCVPGAHGDSAGFGALARGLAAAGAVYALRWPDLDGGPLPRSVESVAAEAAPLLARDLAGRPVVLVGHSFGALVALEVARARAAEGSPVDELVLVDPPLVADRDLSGGEDALVAAALEELRGRGLLGGRAGGGEAARREALAEASLRCVLRYRPERFDGPALLFLARDGRAAPLEESESRWRAVVPTLHARALPGDHFSLLDARLAGRLAREITTPSAREA